MAVNMQQTTYQRGGLIRSGSTVFQSNRNNNDVLILDEQRGAISNPAKFVTFMDDFLGDVLEDPWSGAKGTNGSAVVPAINAQVGGVVRLVSGPTTTVAESISSLTHGLNWEAAQGGLYLETRIKLVTSVADVCVNVGFSDTLATTTLEEPITLSGTTLTTNATNAVVFVFDTAATNDNWHIQGVKADTDTALNNTGVGLTADAWVKLAIAVDSAGGAEFFINDVSYGTVANAVTATTDLTPIITIMSRTTATRTIDADYVFVTASR
jgi:hypothetical protein